MRVLAVNTSSPGDRRIALVPAAVERLKEAGCEVLIEPGLGETLGLSDSAFTDAGAGLAPRGTWTTDAGDAVAAGLQPPAPDLLEALGPGRHYVGLLDPFQTPERLAALARGGASVYALEFIPRTTRAQAMDVLSSQANLAGYQAVLSGAVLTGKVLPMMNTAAGTIRPARVLVVGAGVAGLQAIATAKRLGAVVEAYDTRPAVEEQVRSLGARFVKLDIGETAEAAQGYAKELTKEQLAKQQERLAKHVAGSDLVVTTAQVFGRPAPRIITGDMVAQMQPGSVLVDLAASTGGNVEGTEAGKTVTKNGVSIIGTPQLAEECAPDASALYANNLANFLIHAATLPGTRDPEGGKPPVFDTSDEIVGAVEIVKSGTVANETLAALLKERNLV